MSNVFLLKSDHDREEIGDILINVDKILTMRVTKRIDGIFVIQIDYTHKDVVCARFKCEENLRNELRKLLVAMNADIALASEITIIEDNRDMKLHEDLLASIRRGTLSLDS